MSSEIHREASGQGQPVVLTHGLGDSTATWREQVPALEDEYAVHRWDLIGHGKSARPADAAAYSRDRAVDDLHALVVSCGAPAVLVGHSLGGYLSQCLALRAPQHVRGLVLINTGPGFRDPASRKAWNGRVRQHVHEMSVPAEAVGLVEHHDSYVIDRLGEIHAPVLVIAGGRDHGYHASLNYYARRLPNVETLIVPDAGHHVHRKNAGPVNAAILEFLSRI